ncbi:MAG: iron ABC transporter substrate-binding protein, partial [Deltaproteobacteria bacterium]|nr:iron ABC transporter substrate-binding protein [Deltaproteobacteria bacterium]
MKKTVLIPLLICVAVAGAVTWRLSKTSVDVRTVTVYVSEDQIFSEPILLDFEKET